MVAPVRHRQTKEAATDMFDLQPPRHISTLPDSDHLRHESELTLCAKKRIRAVQQTTALFDHLVRTRLHCRRHAEAEGLGGLEVDVQLDLRAPLHRQIARLFAFENTPGVDTRQTV